MADTGAIVNSYAADNSASFKFKEQIRGKAGSCNARKNVEIIVTLKYLSDFWRTLHLLLINCETELNLKWKKYCLISEIYKTPEVCANPNANLPYPLIQVPTTTAVTFQINRAKLYVPVVTLCL